MDDAHISFYLKAYRIHVFVDALRGIGSPQRICFLLNKNATLLLMVPHSKRDFRSHRVPANAYTGNGGVDISSMQLCILLANQHRWDMSRSYRIPGQILAKQGKAVFDLTKAEMIDRQETEKAPCF